MAEGMDRIRLSGIRATGYHGVFEHERRDGQEFVVDLVLHVDTRPAAAQDRLDLTVDYGVLAQEVADVLTGAPVDLIETLAERVAAVAMAYDAVDAVDVVVHKPQAPVPVPFGDVAVEVHRSRAAMPVVAAPVLQPEPVVEPLLQPERVAEAVVETQLLPEPILELEPEPLLEPEPILEPKPEPILQPEPVPPAEPAWAAILADDPGQAPPPPVPSWAPIAAGPAEPPLPPVPPPAPPVALAPPPPPPPVPVAVVPVAEAPVAPVPAAPVPVVPAPVAPEPLAPEPPAPAHAASPLDDDWVAPALDRAPTGPVDVVLALGSNQGNTQETLRSAVADLVRIAGLEVTAVAPLARTAAVGGPAQPDFLNTVVLGRTTLSPRELLRACQRIETGHGRVRAEHWGPRTLDIDVIVYGTTIAADDELELPHPRAHERAFVLQPWAQVDPDAVLPGLGGGPVAALATTAPDREGIRWLALDWWNPSEAG